MHSPDGITVRRAAVVYDANCTYPDCAFWQQNRTAQRAARDHARETGHVTTCMTMVERTYDPSPGAIQNSDEGAS